jgi:hypothetical protein
MAYTFQTKQSCLKLVLHVHTVDSFNYYCGMNDLE